MNTQEEYQSQQTITSTVGPRKRPLKSALSNYKIEEDVSHLQQPDLKQISRPSTANKPMFHKQKLHPFDFNGEDLAEIKKLFPEFRPRRAVTRTSSKVVGLPIIDLKKKLKEKIQLEGKPLQKLVQKLDHRNEEKITWSEFLTFLENEGQRREVVNDAQLYGIGVKRLQEGQRITIKDNEKIMEYYIDCLCYIQMKQFKLVLTLFENNAAKLLEIENFNVIQELQFSSDYAIPKSGGPSPKNTRSKSNNNLASQETIQRSVSKYILSKLKSSDKNEIPLIDESFLDEQSQNPYIAQNQNDQSGILLKSINNSITKDQVNKTLNFNKWQSAPEGAKLKSYQTQVQKKRNTNNISISKLNEVSEYNESIDQSDYIIKNKRASMPPQKTQDTIHYKSAVFQQETQEQPSVMKNAKLNPKLAASATNMTRSKTQIKSKLSRNNIKQSVINDTTQASSNQILTSQPNLLTTQKDEISSIKQMSLDRREVLRSKQKKKMYGVLGLTKIEDQEGTSAYYYGKDVQRDRPFGIKDLTPNLYQNYDTNKKIFDQIMNKIDHRIKENESQLSQKQLSMKQNKSYYQKSISKHNNKLYGGRNNEEDSSPVFDNSVMKLTKRGVSVNSYSTYQQKDPQQEEIRQVQIKLLAKQNKVKNRIASVMDKALEQNTKLQDLRETNRYFYRMTSPAPNQIEERREKKKKKHIISPEPQSPSNPLHCNPQMISKYVEKLQKDEARAIKDGKFLHRQLDKIASNSETLYEQNRRNKIKHTKQVYSVCANYHAGLQILAISLIDREIKLYRLKQNGSKVSLQELFSFTAKFIVTCIHIEQYVVNSRPILCIGSNQGDVAIYYIDEPVLNTMTKQKDPVKVKQLLHSQFNFFLRGSTKQNELGRLNSQNTINNRQSKNQLNNLTAQSIILEEETQVNSQPNNNTSFPYSQQTAHINELTQLRYIRDIGLIATSLNGTVKIFDGFDFKEVWKTSNKQRKQVYHSQILCFDVSTKLGLMATGGSEGKLILIDPYAFGIINGVQAHSADILDLFIYDEQQQIITIGSDRTILVWDAYRLEKIQSLKDTSVSHTPKFTSAAFDKQHGVLFTGCQALKVWDAKVDSKVEIKALQVETLSRTILKERKMLDTKITNGDQNKNELSSGTIMHGENKNGKVLVTNTSELVDIIINEKEDMQFLVTVDSENLLRAWSVKSSQTTFSYKIPMKKRITSVAIDPTMQYLAVGNCIGEVQILNLRSGGILYNLPHCDSEVTCLQFLQGMSEFWLVGGCWQGRLMMWTNPNEDNNFTVAAKCRIGHRDDVLCVDSSSQYIVSGGIDGLVSIWNLFSGVLKYAIVLPQPSLPNTQNQEELVDEDSDESLSDISEDKETNNKYDYDLDELNDRSIEESKLLSNKGFSNFSTSKAKKSGKKRNKLFKRQSSFIGGVKTTEITEEQEKAAIALKKTIVGLCFHPYYPNFVCVLQEGGDIHVVDASNGSLAYEYVAKVKLNSNWACDKENHRLLVVGDVGKACLFDMTLVNQYSKSVQVTKHTLDEKKDSFTNYNQSRKDMSMFSNSPAKKVKGLKWNMAKPWFQAHNIHKMDSAFVVSVQFAAHIRVFITGTSKGEVKLWNNQNCDCLGVLNSNQWDPKAILQIIQEIRKENKQKEVQRDELKMEELKRKIQQSLKNSVHQ